MRSEKTMLKYISAFAIGDGSLRKRGANAYYRMAQRYDREEYVDYQKNILSDLTQVNKRYYEPKVSKPQYHIETRQHPVYTKVYNRMYGTGRKAIDPHYLTFLDAEYMAIIYMDDGCLSKKYNEKYDRQDNCIILCTESFSYGDNLLLSKAIKEKLDISFDIKSFFIKDTIRYRMRLSKNQTPLFIEKVKPYILDCFAYKTDLERLTPEKVEDIV